MDLRKTYSNWTCISFFVPSVAFLVEALRKHLLEGLYLFFFSIKFPMDSILIKILELRIKNKIKNKSLSKVSTPKRSTILLGPGIDRAMILP